MNKCYRVYRNDTLIGKCKDWESVIITLMRSEAVLDAVNTYINGDHKRHKNTIIKDIPGFDVNYTVTHVDPIAFYVSIRRPTCIRLTVKDVRNNEEREERNAS